MPRCGNWVRVAATWHLSAKEGNEGREGGVAAGVPVRPPGGHHVLVLHAVDRATAPLGWSAMTKPITPPLTEEEQAQADADIIWGTSEQSMTAFL